MTFDGPAIGKRVAAYRRMNGWTMEELAGRMRGAIGKGVIANIETGRKSDVSVKQLVELARALQISPAALMVDLDDLYADIDLQAERNDFTGLTFLMWLLGLPLSHSDSAVDPLPSRSHAEAILEAVFDYRISFRERNREYIQMRRTVKVIDADFRKYEEDGAPVPDDERDEKGVMLSLARRTFERAVRASEDAEQRLMSLMRDQSQFEIDGEISERDIRELLRGDDGVDQAEG